MFETGSFGGELSPHIWAVFWLGFTKNVLCSYQDFLRVFGKEDAGPLLLCCARVRCITGLGTRSLSSLDFTIRACVLDSGFKSGSHPGMC